MLLSAGGRARPSAISVAVASVLLALSGGMLAGCGDSSSDAEPKVTITSVDGDGNLPGEIENAIIVTATNLEPGDVVEFCDAATGVRKTGGVLSQTMDDPPTQITVGVDTENFEAGKTKTIVSRKGVPKGIKEVTYLSGPTYAPGAGIEIDGDGEISTKLSATGGLDDTLGVDTDELGVAPGGIDAAHLGDMGAGDGQVLKWNATNTAWEVADDQTGGAGSGTVDTIVAGPGIAVDDADVVNPIVSANISATGGLAGDLGATSDELGLAPGTSTNDGQVLKWNDTSGVWEFAADETGGGSTDTLQDVVARGGDVLLAAAGADVVDVRNTDDSDGSAAIRGYATGGTAVNYGLYGQSDSNAGYGVYATGNNVGLYATGTNRAAEFEGIVDVTGDVWITGGLIATDDVLIGGFLEAGDVLLNGGATIVGALDTGDVAVGGRLALGGAPATDLEAATKKYVDDSVAAAGGGDITAVNTPAGSGLTGGSITGDVTLGVDFGIAAGTAAEGNHGHTLQEVCDSGDSVVRDAAGTFVISAENINATNQTTAIYGYASGATGATSGVYGRSASDSGYGVFGHAAAATGVAYGVYGRSDSNAGYALCGTASNVGLKATGTNKAAEFVGQVDVTGDVSITGALATSAGATVAGTLDAADVTVTGTMTLNAAGPATDFEAATKKYVDDSVAAAGGGDITGVSATAPLTGGGAVGDVTVGIDPASAATDGYLSSADWNAFDGKADAAHDHSLGGDVVGLVGDTVVVAIHNRPVRNTIPNDGEVLKWATDQWVAQPDAGLTSESQTLHDVVNQGTGAMVDQPGGGAIDVLNTSATGYGVVANGTIGLRATGGTKAAEFFGQVDVTGNLDVSGTITGDGSGLTGVTATEADTLQTVLNRGNTATLTVDSDDALRVMNASSANVSCAIRGQATAATGTNTTGVFGLSSGSGGRGVYGWAIPVSGVTYGVYGRSDSDAGRAVYGLAGSADGVTYGVYGRSDSDGGRGVYGYTGAGTGSTFGVCGESASDSGRGVYGAASAGSGTTYGVYGSCTSPTGYGVYSQGRMHSTGAISTGSTALVTNLNADMVDDYHAASLYRDNADFTTSGSLFQSGTTADVTVADDLTVGGRSTLNGSASLTATPGVTALNISSGSQYSIRCMADSGAAAAPYYGIYSRITGTGTGGKIALQSESTGSGGENYGVQGSASGGAKNYGVYGSTSGLGTNYAVYANGRLHATGAISTGSTALVANLNADTVDGEHATAFADAVHGHNGKPVQPADGFSIIARHAGTGQLAYARIRADGTRGGAFSVVASSFDGTAYRVTLSWFFDPDSSLAVVTPRGSSAPHTWTVDAPGGPDIFVYFYD